MNFNCINLNQPLPRLSLRERVIRMSKVSTEEKLDTGRISAGGREEELEFIINDLNRYRLLFETAQNALMFMTLDGRIFDANASARSIYGYTREELLAINIYDLRENKNTIDYSRVDDELLCKGVMLETVHKRKDGTTFPVETLTRSTELGGKKILMATVKDISERKKQEQEKDELLVQLGYKYNIEKRIAYAARQFLDISHFEDSINFVLEQLGNFTKTDRTFLHMFSESYNNYTSIWCDKKAEAKMKNSGRLLHDKMKWLLESLRHGVPVYFNNIEDMPEEAVEIKKIFLGRSVEAFLMVPIIISNELVGILGAENIKSYTNWTDNDIYIANSIGELVTMTCIRKRVEDRLLERNEELRSTLENLNKAQQQLMQLDKLAGIGQLAAGIAHEINNPLGYIISNNSALKGYMKKIYDILIYYKELVEQLEEHPDPELRKKAAEIRELEHDRKLDFIKDDIMAVMADVEEGLDRISKMVKGLKFVSHRVMDDEFEEYDLNQGIQNTIVVAKNEIKYFAEVKEVLGDIPMISAIGGQINQVLLNMILNSVHAIKEKNPEEIGFINIRTYNDKDNVYCEIEDTGCGITEENMKRLFAPFFTTKPAGLGTGLGLAICYDIIVNTHRGNIKVESNLGVGTKFTLVLPIKPMKTDNTGE